jgi:hypothetical protein
MRGSPPLGDRGSDGGRSGNERLAGDGAPRSRAASRAGRSQLGRPTGREGGADLALVLANEESELVAQFDRRADPDDHTERKRKLARPNRAVPIAVPPLGLEARTNGLTDS